MCDSAANSNILTTGEPAISSAPPLILLQSEEEPGDPGTSAGDSGSAAVDGSKGDQAVASGDEPRVPASVSSPSTVASLLPSSSWAGAAGSASEPAAAAVLSEPWTLDHDDKNPFSGFSEEHLSKLDDVLSSEEVANFLQQTNLNELGAGLEGHSVGVTPSSSNTSTITSATGLRLPDSGHLSDDSLKLDLFDSLPSGSGLPMAQNLMQLDSMSQDSLREYESAIISAAVSDHAYAIPSTTASTPPTSARPTSTSSAFTPSSTAETFTPPSSTSTKFSPRKSARIKQRMDDGKNAFESDSDFEYYLMPRRQVRKEQSDQSDADKASSSPASGSPVPSSSGAKQRQPKRRSTRIVDLENREKAEKILQENRQKEQEALAALQKQKEEEEEEATKTKEEASASAKEADSSPSAKRGKKLGKKGVPLKGKKGKPKQEEGSQEDGSEDGGTPKAQQTKAAGSKATPATPKGKAVKRKKAAVEVEGGEEPKSSPKKKKMGTLAEARKLLKKKKLMKGGLNAKGEKVKDIKGLGKKKKLVLGKGKKGVKLVKEEHSEGSSDDDDIPLQAIAKLPKNDDSKAKDKALAEKVKKDQKPKTGLAASKAAQQAGDGGDKENKAKALAKDDHKKKSVSENSEGKTGSKPKDKKTETTKSGGQQQGSKGDSESVSKMGDKGTSGGGKTEEGATPAKPVKHKHRKSEEVIIDPTVTDLFKPDGVIPTEHLKKDADAVESTGKESKDGAHGSSNVKKGNFGTPVNKNADTSGHRSSIDSKHIGGTPVGQSLSAESKTISGGSSHGRSLSLEGKTTPSSMSHGRSMSVEGGNTTSSGIQGKESCAEDRSGKGVSGEGPKDCGDAGPDQRASLVSILTKHSVVAQAAPHMEHKGGADKKSAVVSAVSESKHTPHDTSVKVKTEKDHSKDVHSQHKDSHHKEHHRHSQDKGPATSQHHHHHHHHQHHHPKEEKKAQSQEHHKHSHHAMKKEDFHVKQERKSLFEIMTKSEDGAEVQRKDGPSESPAKKERKEGPQQKHYKTPKERRHTKDDGHESGGDLSYEDDENDSDWEPANDNSTVYCICRKPHGNRFMICCDKCGEWYHGQCVGVTKLQGQQMEQQNKEYVCPTCSGRPIEQSTTVKQESEKVTSTTTNSKEKGSGTEGRKKSRSSMDDPKTLKKTSDKEKWKIQRCIVGDCKRTARLGSVYCSNGCIIHHARLSLRQLRLDKEKTSGQKVADMRPSEKNHVVVTERRSGKVLSGPGAPTEAQLELWLQTHPSFEVVQSVSNPATFYGKKKDRRSSSQGSVKKGEDKSDTTTPGKKSAEKLEAGATGGKKEEKKEEENSGSTPGGGEEGPDPVRLNVRKSLRDALALRSKEADDVMLSSNEVKRIALRIEEELFKMFNSTGHKYLAKFRSLLFNIKDQKNKALFRKILTRKIRASHLVKMTTQELASKELSKWRKMENKHTLAMIEQTEKEAQKEGQHIRKKTHKGEVEVEEEDMSTLVTHVEEPKSTTESKAEEVTPAVIVDTTDQHRAHLFDLNCKICTGKVLPPTTEEPPLPKKLKVAHHVVEEPKLKNSREGRKKEVTIKETRDVKIMDKKPGEQCEDVTPMDTSQSSAISPETGSTPSSSAASPGPSLPSQSPASSSQGSTLPSHGPTLSSKVTVRSPDSALQSGLEPKQKFTPSGPMVWKGFISMQDFAKFFTSAYRVSGPSDKLGLPDTLQICGRIGPEHMWDYLGKIRQAGSRDVCILRFIPGSDDEKVAYVHLYSYLNSRSRCGVVGNPPKHVKDLYIVPLASHSKIPQVLLPFDGPGLEGNRPHMLIGIVVRQKLKRPRDGSEGSTPGKSPHSNEKSSGSSSAKKLKPSKPELTEAYSPTAEGDDSAAPQALYIPTPTASIVRAASSASSSSSSTPSSTASHSHSKKDKSSEQTSAVSAAKELPILEDAEPYSPSKPVEENDGDAPYDPEDVQAFEVNDGSDSIKKPESAPSDSLVAVSSSSDAGEVKAAAISTNTTTAPTDISSTSASITTPASQPYAVATTSAVNIDSVMRQISASSDPKEISSLMMAMLARAKDSTEQQHLMATLTSKVEQQKKHQADTQPLVESSVLPKTDSSVTSTAAWSVPVSSTAAPTAPESSVSVSSTTKEAVSEPSVSALPVSSSVTSVGIGSTVFPILQVTTTAAPVAKASTSILSSTLLASLSSLASSTETSAGPDTSSVSSVTSSKPAESASSRITSLTPDTDNMPLALKALMEDLKGNTQMVKAVDKRTERDRREREKREASAKEAVEAEKKESAGTKDPQPKESSSSTIPGLGGDKESDTNIPGLGGVVDEGSELISGEEPFVPAADQDKVEEVSSSTDSHKDRLSPLASKAEVLLGDTDLRIQVEPARKPGSVSVLDQDDRFPPRPPLPDTGPPPSHGMGYPPPPSSFILPAPPPGVPPHPPIEVPDIDHRRHVPPPPPMFPRSVMPPPAPYRPPAQPPPPGTEGMEEGDVDMRHPPKRGGAHPHLSEPPFEKMAHTEPPGPARLVPPLPPLPPQPPPPLPPLPSSSGVEGGGPAMMERYDRGDLGHRPPQEHWPRGHEEGLDFDHRRPHHLDHPAYSHRPPHHHHHHSPSPPGRYRSDRHDRDERHRRDRHFHRDRR